MQASGSLRLALSLSLCLAAGASAQASTKPDTTEWLQDFRQLQHEMASHYANLEWAEEERGLNLVELSDTAMARIRRASTDNDARRAIEGFIRAFGDGHLEVRWPVTASGSSTPANQSQSTRGVCAKLGYLYRAPRQRLDWRKEKAYRSVESDDNRYFPIGILEGNKKRIGVLRIDSFEDNVFSDLCERAAARLKISPDSNCADGCAGPLDRETANEMTAALERQIAVLRARKIEALLVDIVDNGGGTNWVEAAARVLTAKPLHSPRVGFIRHAHYVNQLTEQIAGLREDSVSATGSARELVTRALVRSRSALDSAKIPCVRDSIWVGKKPSCSLVVLGVPRFATGMLDYAKPGSVPKLENCCAIYYPARYTFHEGAYTGPLMVLVNRETASAAEYFAAILADNNAATIIGEPTYGAGCGYTNGGIPTTLANSKGRIVMPDCIRLRRDGTNEVAGITPQVLIPWRGNDSGVQRARRVLEVILR